MTKSEIRCSLSAIRDNMLLEDKLSADKKLRDMLYGTQVYQRSTDIFCFVSFRSETDTHEIIEHSLSIGKRVYIPRIEPHGMEFYQIQGLKGLKPSKYGIPEPRQDVDKLYIADIPRKDHMDLSEATITKLMLLPGLAFDYKGNRIGYGGGYYDKYLDSFKILNFYKVALAYDFQLIDNIDACWHDIRVDMIVTPSKILVMDE